MYYYTASNNAYVCLGVLSISPAHLRNVISPAHLRDVISPAHLLDVISTQHGQYSKQLHLYPWCRHTVVVKLIGQLARDHLIQDVHKAAHKVLIW